MLALTFLEFPRLNELATRQHTVGTQTFTEDEVLVLPGGVDPNDLYAGYSPSRPHAGGRRSMIAIADFPGWIFENGAVPSAGRFIITTNAAIISRERRCCKDAHRGAGSNNTLSPTRTDQLTSKTGKPRLPRLLSGCRSHKSNKDIDSRELIKQVDKWIDTSFGVSAIMKGIDDSHIRQCTGVSRYSAENVVDPLLLRNYTQPHY